MHRICLILLFLLPMISAGQNLVPNPSFEEYYDCPHSNGSIQLVPFWERVGESGAINLYHECGYNGYGIPVNKGGGGFAHSGQAYVDLILWIDNESIGQNWEGNFLGAPLTSPLDSGMKYLVSLHVSLWDSMNYAVSNLGVCITQGQPSGDIASLLSLSPQVVNQSGLLDDKSDWILVEGDFIAEGGENYLTIGNFEGYENTPSVYVGDGGVPPPNLPYFWDNAYYFVDDVSVIADTTYHVGIQEPEFIFSIYPNPATTNITVESRTPLAQVWVNDVAGRAIMNETLRSAQSDKSTIDVSSLPSGIYLVEVFTQNGQRSVQKVVVR